MKKLNPQATLVLLTNAFFAAKLKMSAFFNDLPEDPNGTPIEYDHFKNVCLNAEKSILADFQNLFGGEVFPDPPPDLPPPTPDLPPPIVLPELPELPARLFEGHRWEDSDNPKHPGKSWIMPKPGLRFRQLTVNGEAFKFEKIWNNNAQLWYGPVMGSFESPATITAIESHSLFLYRSEPINLEGNTTQDPENIVWETYYHHTHLNGSDGGVSLVLCPGDSRRLTNVRCGNISIPQHGPHMNGDKGRTAYWKRRVTAPDTYITAEYEGRTLYFKTRNYSVLDGSCR